MSDRLSNAQLDAIGADRKRGQFDPDYLGELTARANEAAKVGDMTLADYLEDARERYTYYIGETGDYLEATVREAARRLRRLKGK